MAIALADRDELERGFRRLTPEQRTVVVLHHYLGYPLTEVAATLGIPVGTARSRLHYATRQLRVALEADARPRTFQGADRMTTRTAFEERLADWLEEGPTARVG